MKKQTLYFDHSKAKGQLDTLTSIVRNDLNPLIGAYLALKIGGMQSLEQLLLMAEKPTLYAKARIAENLEIPKVGIFKISREKMIDIIELPDFELLETLGKGCCQAIANIQSSTPNIKGLLLTHCSITDNRVAINKDAAALINEACTFFADTPEKIAFYEAHTKLVEALNVMRKIAAKTRLRVIPLNRLEDLLIDANGAYVARAYWYAEHSGDLTIK